ncbi:unnamed protein product [Hyaloperonospora brassicae]|uniref:Homologous-pairing protein 2 winged helix domain-containing protein n=1 Tax=Hyaloperonospora brassicae TaxID=162125 RepID=A0AAV0U1V2_HYABA|nr:unnamed protein product [Hyaloperonospora brassicae]
MSDVDDDDFSLGEDSLEAESSAFDEDEADEDDEDSGSEKDDVVSVASDVSDVDAKALSNMKKAAVGRKKSPRANTKSVRSKDARKLRSVVESGSRPETAAHTKKEKALATVQSVVPPKPTAMTAAKAEAAVLDYMRKTNRPYSLLNVFENMHRAIAKSSLTTLLDNLVAKKELVSKTYGKAKVYFVNQDNLPVPSEEERAALEEQIKTVTAECTGLEQQLKNAETALAGITSQVSDIELDTMLKQLDEEAAALEKKVATLDQQGRAPLSPGRKDALKRKFTQYRTAWVTRKRIAMDGINQIADGMEKRPKVVLGLVGLETDEEAGVKELPTM